jgi:hypothetical protein
MGDHFDDSDIPVLLGVTGDACGACSATTVPLYDLPCHDSDDFYCRNCLTTTWCFDTDEVVRCPACHKDCGFAPLPPVEGFNGIARDFVDREALNTIRQQPEIQNNLIAFTAAEGLVLLQRTYDYYLDQLLDPVELGGLPSYMADTSDVSLATNPYYSALVAQITMLVATPGDLEEDFLEIIKSITINDVKFKYSVEMDTAGVDLADKEAVFWQAIHTFPDIGNVFENWEGIIKMWVDLLAWRHIERVAPAEGGSAERFREPLSMLDLVNADA